MKAFVFFSMLAFSLIKYSSSAEIKCDYKDITWYFLSYHYSCAVQNNLNIETPEDSLINAVNGNHTNGRDNFNVTSIHIIAQKVKYFPQGLKKFFKNIKGIWIENCKLKVIHQSDLIPFPKLVALYLQFNEIEVLEEGLFDFNSNLEHINFHINKISKIHPNIFDHLTKLQSLDLRKNQCINMSSLKSIEKTKDVISEVKSKCPSPEPMVGINLQRVPCGKPLPKGVGNIIGGNFISRGSYPWIAAMIYKQDGNFFCSGTVISDRKVLTAAHCIQDKENKIKLLPNQLNVLLGVHNISSTYEPGRRSIPVHKIHVHPEWNYTAERFDADIAVLVLKEIIKFDQHIQPICSIKSSPYAAEISKGIVVGYGKSENEWKIHEETPKIIVVPIHSNEDCFLEFSDLARISSSRTFCGGTANGTGVCLGDSGSGLIVRYSDVYYLRGIVSSSIRTFRWGCDVEKYSIFTDVLKYLDWIDGVNVDDTSFGIDRKLIST